MITRKLVVVDLSAAENSMTLHRVLASSFGFPDHYGQNWDAFRDSVTTLDPMPEKILVRGMKALSDRLPRDAEQLTNILVAFRSEPDLDHVKVEFE